MLARLRRLPVGPQALASQLAAALAALLFELLAQSFSAPSLWRWALAQAALAAGGSRLLRQPVWWFPIHLLFVPGALAATTLAAPAWLYLAAFLGLALVYWGNHRTRVPLFLSDEKAWRALLALLPEGGFRFVDLGSGLGAAPLWLARRRPDGDYLGIEIAPLPWLVSRLRAALSGSPVRFVRGDYARLDLGGFDLVFAFLSPAAMPDLWDKARAEMRPGSRLVSLSFEAPRKPDETVILAEGERHRLYVWRM